MGVMNSIERIWREYHNKLHSFIQSRVGDSSTADDILQEVFARIHSRIDTLRDSSKIQSWIYQITRNAIIDFYRAQKNMAELPESLSNPEMDPNDKSRQEITSWLMPMIQGLPENYLQALMLSEIEGLPQKEVAKKLGLSLPGAKARIQRGRVLLKKMLLDCCSYKFDRKGHVIDYESKAGSCDDC
jgi:RNA polymerase sigma-70 factor (ECF subfamily)